MSDPYELPMFPLGSVLLPGMVLPLQVFEPRYRVLVDTVLLADEPEFGSVMIERGNEVGGGDVRATVGCIARIVDFTRHEDGVVTMVAVGTRRITVEDWLDDDPFPRALVADWPDGAGRAADQAADGPDQAADVAAGAADGADGGPDQAADGPDQAADVAAGAAGAAPGGPDPIGTGPADAGPTDAIDRLERSVRDLITLAAELGLVPTLEDAPLSSDDELRVYQLATVSPLGAHDRLRVLRSPGLAGRVELLEELIEEQHLLLEARRSFGQE